MGFYEKLLSSIQLDCKLFSKIIIIVIEGTIHHEKLDYTTKLPEQEEILYLNKLKQIIKQRTHLK